jgi:TonB family protein
MPVKSFAEQRVAFGLLPEPERRPGSFIASMVVNGSILALLLYMGTMARRTINQHIYQETLLTLPSKAPSPQPKPKVKIPPPPPLPKTPEIKLEASKIQLPMPEIRQEMKPVQAEAKLAAPVVKMARPAVSLAPQTRSALAAAAMPAQDNHVKFSTKPVHFGQTFGVTPNSNARRPATVAAIGNPYGGMRGPAVAPHGIVGSAGFGNGTRLGSNAGVVGKVASAGFSGPANTRMASQHGRYESRGGRVASAGISSAPTAVTQAPHTSAEVRSTQLEVISKPPVQYTSEARQLRVQGEVVLRVTFAANGKVVVRGVMHGLGHGLDEEARRVAQQIRFRPAKKNGQPVDLTTNITITFQLA